MSNQIDFKELGLDLGLTVFKYFFKSEYLHYGYWKNNLVPEIGNLKQAQEHYTEFLCSQIPCGACSILDVGAGSGKVAEQLLNQGFRVDCVSPSKLLTERIRQLIGDRGQVYFEKFEDVEIQKKYDLILFSESFQYIDLKQVFSKALHLLRPGGFILICDFFQIDPKQHSPLGGGHPLQSFWEVAHQHPMKKIQDIDITSQIAPTMAVVNDFTLHVLQPVFRLGFQIFEKRYPTAHKLFRWKYRKKIEKFKRKHFSGERNEKNFLKHKSYRLVIFQKSV